MTDQERQLLANVGLIVEALVGLVHPDVFAASITRVQGKRAALEQARAEVAPAPVVEVKRKGKRR
jgi:hypothetical protein